MTTSTPATPAPDVLPTTGRPVMGYSGRRLQLLSRHLTSPLAAAPFIDVDHVLDHLATMPVGTDQPGAQSIFAEDRRRLLAAIRSANAVFLSSGRGLLAYKCGSPRRWRVLHARSGAPMTFFGPRSLGDPRPWTRLSDPVSSDLSDAAVHAYVHALEALVDPRGLQIDWTSDFPDLFSTIPMWQDHDDTGALPEPGGASRFGGMDGLHLAAVLHAISADPLREAASGQFSVAIAAVIGPRGGLRIRDRPGALVDRYLADLDNQYNHGRRRYDRLRDWRIREDLREDRATGKVVSLARLLAFGGLPHRAAALLRDRADCIRNTDARRRDGAHSTALVIAARMIAELFSPVETEFERLHRVHKGQFIVEATTHHPFHVPPHRVWLVTETAHQVCADFDGNEHYLLGVRERTEGQCGTLRVRPGFATITIDYADGGSPHHLEPSAGHWALVDDGAGVPRTSSEVLDLAGRAMAAFDRDDPLR